MPTPESWSPASFSTLTGVNRVDALMSGVQWASGALDYSFPQQNATWSTDPDTGYGPGSGEAEPWVEGYQGLSSADEAAAQRGLAAWGRVAGLQFTRVVDNATTVGDIRFAFVADSIAQGAQAFAYYPEEAAYGGDVWFNVDASNFSSPWQDGSYEYMTLLHELGHALGLKHPFEQETLNPNVLAVALDTRSFTLMSYSAGPGDPGSVFTFEPTTPMLLDIAAIQALYGPNTQWHAGDNTYRFAGDALYHRTIWDAGGVDAIVLEGSASGSIDLRAGMYGSRVGAGVFLTDSFGRLAGRVDNLWIAYGTVIENAAGANGADRITGNAAGNRLRGAAGADSIEGGAGSDTLLGNPGRDRLDGGTGHDVLVGGWGADTLGGGAGADQFVFSRAPGPRNIDTVGDFTHALDTLVLDRLVFTALPAGSLDPAALQAGDGTSSALDADDRLLYDTTTGALYYDADGTGPIEAVRFATLGTATHPELAASDFLVTG